MGTLSPHNPNPLYNKASKKILVGMGPLDFHENGQPWLLGWVSYPVFFFFLRGMTLVSLGCLAYTPEN